MRCYEISLPMPVSINAAHAIGKNRKGGHIIRSKEYNDWIIMAGVAWRQQYPRGITEIFKGRIRVDYKFFFIKGARGISSSDIANREKVLSDFLQGKFFENDNQIDEQHQYRRLKDTGTSHVFVRITEVEDARFIQEACKRPKDGPR